MMNLNSFFGFLTLVVYVSTLIPSNLTKVFPHTREWKINRFLLKQRRLLGLLTFSLSIDHVIISLAKYQINLLNQKTYFTYYTGISIFIIFTILALTSNNWSTRKLKSKWRKLHSLTYLAMFLLLWHIFSLMKDSWTWLTPIGLNLLSLASLIYLTRLLLDAKKSISNKLKLYRQSPLITTQLESKNTKKEEIKTR